MRLSADWLEAPGPRAVMAALSGHRAYFVGGCVRNAVLGTGATDIDVTTDALPERVIELAEATGLHAVPTGIDHGTVTVVAHGQPVEVTTFRRDVATDGRRAVVAFAETPQEDARRRDFTMNALYADAEGAVLDPVGGLGDLRDRRVRFIGDAEARIREDYLRILRFFRFHAWYGRPGEIDAEGLAACAAEQDGIDRLSRERVGAETLKLLAAPDPAPAVASMASAGILARILPGAEATGLAPLVHIESQLDLAPDPIRRLAALGGQGAASALRLYRAQAALLERLRDAALGTAPAAELGYRMGAAEALSALSIRHALAGDAPPDTLEAEAEFGAAQVLPVAARDLMPGYEGPALGDRLRRLETAWIGSGFTLDRKALLVLPDGEG